ncbi:MAG: IscS subfamily cysteine desulfurase [Bacteroidetes bacterium 43-93]|nr:cysteine desulfurase [Bacteroidota bacterium]OJW99599.1 MAG: IscS subfamily cysteine desulfurase [Bacteroidetes bacterium 43-93]
MIYLDNNATTRIDPRVLDKMMPYLTEEYANASSNHAFGQTSSEAVKKARLQVAELIGCESNEIIFTSGATESINIGIKGLMKSEANNGKHLITVATEHPAVLDTCKHLEAKGYDVTYLPVNEDGLIELDQLKKSLRPDTVLVCVMYANNETGVIQPIKEISKLAHENGSYFMTDATQAAGKIDIDVNAIGIDILAFSGHKIYGPKGSGVLYIRSRQPFKVKLASILHGGGQEKGIRSGTLNVPNIVGLGQAAFLAKHEMAINDYNVRLLRDYLQGALLNIEHSRLIGNDLSRMYNVCSICFKGADADAVMMGLENISLSNGSACSSTSVEPSHVLKAMGLSDEDSFSTIRFSLGKFNTKAEIDIVINAVSSTVQELRLLA